MIELDKIIGIVIAGGQATRMGGGDKTLLALDGKPILSKLLEKLEPQVASVAINSNSRPINFAQFNIPIFPDIEGGFQGPLAGILASMEWTKEHHPTASHIVTVAGDSPFFPDNLVARFITEVTDKNTIVMAQSDGFNHPVFALWPLSTKDDLQKWLAETGILKVMAWVRTQPNVMVDFTNSNTPDPFFNINTPNDLLQAKELIEASRK